MPDDKISSTSMTFIEKVKAGYSGIYLLTSEAIRTVADILTAAKATDRRVFVWTLGKGLWEEFTEPNKKPVKAMLNGAEAASDSPSEVLGVIPQLLSPEPDNGGRRRARAEGNTKAIFVLTNFHHFLDDPGAQAKIIEIVNEFKSQRKMLVLMSPLLKLPVELEKDFALVETDLPTKEDLLPILDAVITGSSGSPPDDAKKAKLVEAALGLTAQEAENAFALSYVRPKQKNKINECWDPAVVMEEKCSTLRKTGLLQFYPPGTQGMKMMGGINGLKSWVSRRKRAFTKAAIDFGLPPPKGILMVGVPGTGKSLGAKAIGEELGLPLLRCDIGRIFAGIVGSSEQNARSMIKIAEAVAPCVLWIDEIEKGFAGATTGLDSGVGARVMGTILTWMQEKAAPVFVYATANRVDMLPPEMLRKGRFDEIFFVDLPNKEERKEIFEVHLKKRGRERLIQTPNNQAASLLDLEYLASKSDKYSGSEIEAAIVDAMYRAFENNTELNSIDTVDALDSMVPLSTTMKNEVEALRAWGKGRARPANEADLRDNTHVETKKPGRVLQA
jgi:MoxR-like ATPase